MGSNGEIDFNSVKASCQDLCLQLQQEIENELLYVQTKTVTSNETFSSKSTVSDKSIFVLDLSMSNCFCRWES